MVLAQECNITLYSFSLFQKIHVQMKHFCPSTLVEKFKIINQTSNYVDWDLRITIKVSKGNCQDQKNLAVLQSLDYTTSQLVKSSVLGNRGKPKSTSEKSAIDRYEWHAMITQGISNCNLKSQKLKSCSIAKKKQKYGRLVPTQSQNLVTAVVAERRLRVK